MSRMNYMRNGKVGNLICTLIWSFRKFGTILIGLLVGTRFSLAADVPVGLRIPGSGRCQSYLNLLYDQSPLYALQLINPSE